VVHYDSAHGGIAKTQPCKPSQTRFGLARARSQGTIGRRGCPCFCRPRTFHRHDLGSIYLGAFWTNDPKLNGTAVAILIYLAYFVLRSSVEDPEKRARLAGTYNVFAFVLMIVFIGVLPRMTDSLHPGNGGNPAFGSYDLDSGMRAVFYPAVFGWIGIGLWVVELRVRLSRLTK